MSIADTIEDTFAARNPATMAAAIVDGMVGAIADSVDPQTVTTRLSGGSIFKEIAWQGKLWALDPDDSTTDHDEITCIRTIDSDGYLTNDLTFPPAVLSRSVTTPPAVTDSPPVQYGDQYLVPDGATDDWAGHEGERTRFTARGWKFKDGAHGEIVLVEDEGESGEFIHFNADDAWEDGLPGNLIDLSVRPSAMLIRSWAAENQTTTAPPSTGPAAEQYIIGPSATGVWAGQDKKIAWRPSTDAAFVITTPFVGEEVYDKTLGIRVKWDGSAWASSGGVIVGAAPPVFTPSTTNTATASSAGYSYSETVAPTTSQGRTIDNNGISYAAKRAGSVLILKYQAEYFTLSNDANHNRVVAIYRDSEANAIAWQRFWYDNAEQRWTGALEFTITSVDTTSHTYKVAAVITNAAQDFVSITRRLFQLQEMA